MTKLSSAAEEVLLQLFVNGPIWDGNVVSKSGRDELFDESLCWCKNGWQGITAIGLEHVLAMDLKDWYWQEPYRKQQMY